MRGENGTGRLVVCLSEYLPLRNVYRILSMSMTAVELRGLFHVHIGHGRSVGVCFPNKVKLYRINRHFLMLIRIGKQNVEILYIKVEIEKSKNELFQISWILMYLCSF